MFEWKRTYIYDIFECKRAHVIFTCTCASTCTISHAFAPLGVLTARPFEKRRLLDSFQKYLADARAEVDRKRQEEVAQKAEETEKQHAWHRGKQSGASVRRRTGGEN